MMCRFFDVKKCRCKTESLKLKYNYRACPPLEGAGPKDSLGGDETMIIAKSNRVIVPRNHVLRV